MARSRLANPCALALVVLAVLAPPAAGQAVTAGPAPTPLAGEAVPGQVVVQYRSGTGLAARGIARSRSGVRLGRRLPLERTEVVQVTDGTPVAAKVRELERDPQVAVAEPNWVVRAYAIPDDTRFGDLWGLHNTGQTVNGLTGTPDADIDAPEAWDVTRGSDTVAVAVIDTGATLDHPDLAPNLWQNPGETGGGKETNGVDDDGNGFVDDSRGWDAAGASPTNPDDADNDPSDPTVVTRSHGTHVAGTVAAVGDNARGVIGVAPGVEVIPVRALGESGSGTSADVIEAMVYATAAGARIVNMSLGSAGASSLQRSIIQTNPGVLWVVAAGNDGFDLDLPGNNSFPCEHASANVVCVASTTSTDGRLSTSNFSEVSVDLGAPGTNVLSTVQRLETAFLDTFESDPFTAGPWTKGTTAGTNAWGLTASAPLAGASSVADSPAGSYAASTDTHITRQAVSLANRRFCEYTSLFAVNAAAGDGAYVGISQTGTFGPPGGLIGGVQSGTLGAELDGFASAIVRHGFKSDAATNGDGVKFDNTSIVCQGTTYTADLADALVFFNGTSMASPHVAGAAALLLSHAPGASPATLKAELQAGVEPKAELASTQFTAWGGRLNARASLARPAAWVDGATVKFRSPPGLTDNVTVSSPSAGVVRIADAIATPGFHVVPGRGCVAAGTAVDCTVTGTPLLDVATGDGSDTIRVDAAVAGTLRGGLGNDILRGGTLKDTIDGEAGADTVSYGTRTARVAITLDQVANDGADPNGDRVSSASEEQDALVGIESAIAGGGPDYLRAVNVNATRNSLSGGGGDDRIKTREGTATIDSITCGTGADQFDKDPADTANADCETAAVLP